MKLDGKAALITGAATGVGRASAILFAKEGAKVAVADINEKDALETVQIIKKAGGDAFFVSVDLVKIAEIEVMVRTTVATFGKLNIFYTPTP
ncbi:MAG: SDR family NAD(P)-dependent oxidoreductase [Xanthobacteraceae bacterium]|jgi:NAD(P)-dependent dehydrogenase (short-subunit alcohol dehydrogenase family)